MLSGRYRREETTTVDGPGQRADVYQTGPVELGKGYCRTGLWCFMAESETDVERGRV